MQNRSPAFQAVLFYTREAGDNGTPYATLVLDVAQFIEEPRAHAYRLSRLKRTPNESDSDTTSRGQIAIARKYIDAACSRGLVYYTEYLDTSGRLSSPRSPHSPHGRRVHWNRFARTGGPYGSPDGRREAEAHAAFYRYIRAAGARLP